ncbi:MAG: hypothetical protein ABWY20_05405, partial [Mycobacterium sp.]
MLGSNPSDYPYQGGDDVWPGGAFRGAFSDGNRAKDFYQQVFGWKLNDMPEMKYTGVATGPVAETGMPSEPGYIGGGM